MAWNSVRVDGGSTPVTAADFNMLVTFVTNAYTAATSANATAISALTQITTLANQRTYSDVTRSINNTGYQISATQDAIGIYSVKIVPSITLSGGAEGTITAETSPDNSVWTVNATYSNGSTGAVVVGISLNQPQTGLLLVYAPRGSFVKLKSTTNSGSPTFSYINGREILL